MAPSPALLAQFEAALRRTAPPGFSVHPGGRDGWWWVRDDSAYVIIRSYAVGVLSDDHAVVTCGNTDAGFQSLSTMATPRCRLIELEVVRHGVDLEEVLRRIFEQEHPNASGYS
jgi:hypothetical protein